jgi:cupin 2 domain-containing protein
MSWFGSSPAQHDGVVPSPDTHRTGRLPAPAQAPPAGETFLALARCGTAAVEVILSSARPDTAEQVQDHDEWVVLLDGGATLEVGPTRFDLGPGDWLALPAGVAHRVVATTAGSRWLAVHGGVPSR